MNELPFYGEKLCCLLIMTNYLEDLSHPPELACLAFLLALLVLVLAKYKSSPKTLFLLIAVALDILFSLTHNNYYYASAVLFCFLNLFLPVRHYMLPEVPEGVGYVRFRIPAPYNIDDACIFYPTPPTQKKKVVDWLIPSFVEKMHGNDRSPFRIPLFLLKFGTAYMKRYKLSFSDEQLRKGVDQAIVFSHGLSANIHVYSSLLTRLVSDHRIVIAVQHTEKYSFSAVPISQRHPEIIKRAQNLLDAYDFLGNELEMRKLLGNNYIRPNNTVLMGHSYGGGTIVQAESMLAGRQVKASVALDPWLVPVKEQFLRRGAQLPTLSIENEDFTRDAAIAAANERFWECSSPSSLIRLNLKHGHHLHQCDLSFILGSTLGLVNQPELSWEWHSTNIGIIETFLDRLDKHHSLDQIESDIFDNFKTRLNESDSSKGT